MKRSAQADWTPRSAYLLVSVQRPQVHGTRRLAERESRRLLCDRTYRTSPLLTSLAQSAIVPALACSRHGSRVRSLLTALPAVRIITRPEPGVVQTSRAGLPCRRPPMLPTSNVAELELTAGQNSRRMPPRPVARPIAPRAAYCESPTSAQRISGSAPCAGPPSATTVEHRVSAGVTLSVHVRLHGRTRHRDDSIGAPRRSVRCA
jgi:hypothetical protein